MRNKAESFQEFKEFQNEVWNHTGKTIKFLRSNHGGEYLSHEFSDHLKNCGIVPQLTLPGMPMEWCVRAKKPNLVGHGEVNDESN